MKCGVIRLRQNGYGIADVTRDWLDDFLNSEYCCPACRSLVSTQVSNLTPVEIRAGSIVAQDINIFSIQNMTLISRRLFDALAPHFAVHFVLIPHTISGGVSFSERVLLATSPDSVVRIYGASTSTYGKCGECGSLRDDVTGNVESVREQELANRFVAPDPYGTILIREDLFSNLPFKFNGKARHVRILE